MVVVVVVADKGVATFPPMLGIPFSNNASATDIYMKDAVRMSDDA